MKHLVIDKVINGCGDCAYFADEFRLCCHPAVGDRDIIRSSPVPKWCPLPDAPIERGAEPVQTTNKNSGKRTGSARR